MKRNNKLIITIILLIIFIMTLIFNVMRNVSLAVDQNTSTDNTGNSQGGSIMKPGNYLSPYPVFYNYKIDGENYIVEVSPNTTVIELLDNIKIKLMDDETGREWELTDLPQTFKDKNGEEKKVIDVEKWEGREKAIYGAYIEEVDDRITFWATDINGKTLGINDRVGTGTKIEWGTSVIAGELEIMETVSIKGDVTGDGTSNIYDITGLVSLVYDQTQDYQWNPAVKQAAIVTEQEKDEPDIYDIQQMVVNNFDN